MSKPLRVLMVEDSEDDAQLLLRELRRGGYEPTSKRVDTPEGMAKALADKAWDIIVADHSMPGFDSLVALALLQKTGLDLPFIIVSGTINEEIAVAAMKAGAHDYILKANLTRLAPAIEREMESTQMRRKHRQDQERIEELARFPEESPNPILRFLPDGTVLYGNPPGQILLDSWSGELPSPLPENLRTALGECFSSDVARLLEVEAQGRVYSFFCAPVVAAGYVNLYGRDITMQKQAEEALRASEERFRMILASSPDSITVTDLEGTITECNEAMLRLHRYSRKEDVLGRSAFELVGPGNREKAMGILARALEAGSIDNVEITLLTRDGLEFPAECSASAIRDSLGRPTAFVVISHDITMQKQAEEEVRQSEERFRSIFDNATDGILVADLENRRFTMANRTICQMLGYALEEIQNLGVADIHPVEALPRVLEEIGKQARGDYTLAGGLPVKRKDGSVFYADINSAPVSWGGKAHIVGIFRDITERKRAEEALRASEHKFRSFIEQSSDGILLIDQHGLVTEWNQGHEEITGLRREEVLGRPLWEVLSEMLSEGQRGPELLQRAHREILELLRTRESPGSILPFAQEILRPDGTRRTVQTVVFPIVTDAGFLAGSISRDITEQKAAEEALENAALDTLLALSTLIEAKDPYTGGHSQRVTEFALKTAGRMGEGGAALESLRVAGLTHDVGKVGIPDSILNKPTRLSRAEWLMIHAHPEESAAVVEKVSAFRTAVPIIRHHHEAWDGSGYPDGLKGAEIPLLARILTVVDWFEAMTADRPYRPALGREKALAEIKKNSGVKLDPQVVEAFLQLAEEGAV